ncbi:hypothetical protein, conserved [Babesia bigemina]|uniref:Uncharacterized protein n=1 Tax=Babesia bigemina TaxID=5866 RepID=A0A061D562_BABBI|nr:hypothetical protein, conserved [Babesia bigemina]CDR95187.1 hypothetical protein, conserved [Babesia bigemina]|eukprot:XP_012767373.1 hypothetical protein, conserved [Babesia bigemina]
MYSAQRFVPLRDAGLEQASVRRYNVDFCQVYANPDSVVHDGSGSLKLYVVARRNSTPSLQAYMPYDVFTHVNDWVDLQEACSVADEDIFDNGISSSDEEGSMYIGGASPPLIASPEPFTSPGRASSAASRSHPHHFDSDASTVRSATRSAARSPSQPSARRPVYDAVVPAAELPQDEGIADEIVEDDDGPIYHGVSPPPVLSRSPAPRSVSFAKPVVVASPRPRGKRTISGRNNLSPPSPTGYSPFASFGAVYSSGLQGQTAQDIAAVATDTLAALRDLNPVAPRATAPNVDPAPAPKRKTKRGTRSKRAPAAEAPETVSMASAGADGMGLRIVDASVVDPYPIDDTFDEPYYPTYHATDDLGEDTGTGDLVATSELSGHADPPPAAASDAGAKNRKRSRKRVSTAVLSLPPTTVEELPAAAGTQRHPDEPRAIADTAAPAAAPSLRHDQGVQTLAVEPMRTSLGVGNDDFDMDEYNSLADRVTAGSLGPKIAKKPAPTRERRPRKAVNSAMLLNSWYISYVDDRKGTKKRYEPVDPYVGRNRRYPSRARLPPIQHWNSNITPDGSSVLFLIGVTSDDTKLNLQAQHASGDVVLFNEDAAAPESSPSARVHPDNLPEASLVMTDSSGMMEMQVIESSPMARLALSDRAHNVPTATSTELALADVGAPAVEPGAKRRRSRRAAKVPASDGDIGVDAGTAPRSAPAKGKAKRAAPKPKPGGRKRTRQMTVSEALEILKSDSAGSSLGLDESPKSRRQSEFYQELAFNHPKKANVAALPSDSIAMQDGRHISYRSFFRVDEVETQMYHGSLFQPLVMNSRCRSSNVIIPVGCHVSMGNVNGNFICGYLYCGENVAIRGLGISWPLKAKQTFFLPIYEEWGIYNESRSMDANIALTFVSI